MCLSSSRHSRGSRRWSSYRRRARTFSTTRSTPSGASAIRQAIPGGPVMPIRAARAESCTKGSRGGEPARSQAARRASIALTAACRCVPSAAGPPSGARVQVRPTASGRRVQGRGCRFRVGTATSRPERADIAKHLGGGARWTWRTGSTAASWALRSQAAAEVERPVPAAADTRGRRSNDRHQSQAGARMATAKVGRWPTGADRLSPRNGRSTPGRRPSRSDRGAVRPR
jgi:hypothetical protein